MKKVLLIAVLTVLCAGMSINAQGLKDVWFAGGTLSISTEKPFKGGDRTKEFTVLPMVGTFISPSLAVGGAIGYSQVDPVSDGEFAGTKSQKFIIQPLVRKYWNISGKLYVFTQASLPISFGNVKQDGDKIGDSMGFGFAFTPGLDLIVNNWLSIEASFNLINLSYTTFNPKGDGDRVNNFSFKGDALSSTKFGDITVGVKILF